MKPQEAPLHISPHPTRAEAVHEAVHSFMHTGRLHRAAIERTVADLGIHPTQHRMLMHIKRCGGCVSQKELSEEFRISPAAVAVTLGKLEKAGYILRTVEAGDGRCKRIAVTEAGDALLRISYDSFCAVDLAMFADLTDEELLSFTETLGRLQAAVTALAPERKEPAE